MRYIFLISASLLFSCSSNKKVPKDVLPPEKMQTLVWDLLRADEMLNYRKMRDSSYNSTIKTLRVYDTVLYVHQLTKEQLERNFEYYESRPDLLKNILDSLQRKTEGLQTLPPSVQ